MAECPEWLHDVSVDLLRDHNEAHSFSDLWNYFDRDSPVWNRLNGLRQKGDLCVRLCQIVGSVEEQRGVDDAWLRTRRALWDQNEVDQEDVDLLVERFQVWKRNFAIVAHDVRERVIRNLEDEGIEYHSPEQQARLHSSLAHNLYLVTAGSNFRQVVPMAPRRDWCLNIVTEYVMSSMRPHVNLD